MRKTLCILLAVIAAFTAAAQNSIRVQAPSLVGVGEQFNVIVTVEGNDNPSDPEWSLGDEFQLVWGPQRIGTSSSINIVNGNRSKSVSYTFKYILLPKVKGTFTLPAATATVGGEKVTSNRVTVEVATDDASSGGQQISGGQTSPSQLPPEPAADLRNGGGDVFLRFSINKNKVIVGEPVTGTLKLFTRADVAGFEDARFPTFNGFWSQETYAPNSIQFRRENIGDKIYNTVVLREYTLIPQQTGDIVIEPAEIVCVMNVRSEPTGLGSIFDSFFTEYETVRKKAVSAGYTVHVSALPDGAPESFCGGVGNFSLKAELDCDTLKVHEAASLKITVSGKGNISLVEAPKVNFPPDFEVYDVKITDNIDNSGMSGSKTFEYPFIPRSHGEFTIDPIEYGFYDIQAGKYDSVSTDPISLSVRKADGSVSEPVTAVFGNLNRKNVKDLGNDIRYISLDAPAFSRKGKFFALSPAFWILALLILALGVFLYIFMKRSIALKQDVAGSRNRGAVKMARKRLSQAGEFLQKNLYSAFYEELHRALLGFASDKLNIPVADLSKDNILESLRGSGVAEELSKDFVGLIDACEYARYSPDQGHEAMDAHYKSALSTISAIDSNMKKSGKSASAAVMLALLFAFAPAAADAAESFSADSLWNAGVGAYSASQWDSALHYWTELELSGVESPELYYNLGNAYFKSGDLGHSVIYYERALKLKPSYRDARHNLEFVNVNIQDNIEEIPEFFLKTWLRKLCWLLPADIWAVLFLVLLAALAVLVPLFLLSQAAGTRKTSFFCGIAALLLCVISLSCAVWQKSDYMSASDAVVVSGSVSVKSSPSDQSSSDLFVLHEGTKVRILDSVGEWRKIELADGREGWLPAGDTEII